MTPREALLHRIPYHALVVVANGLHKGSIVSCQLWLRAQFVEECCRRLVYEPRHERRPVRECPQGRLSAVLLHVACEKRVGDVVDATTVDLGVRAKYTFLQESARFCNAPRWSVRGLGQKGDAREVEIA
jgi:hypothetical protein